MEPQAETHGGHRLLEVSNALVALQKELFGRGPTKARTYMFEDLVVCLLQGGFTRAERTLQEHGRRDLVEEGRSELQYLTRDRMVAAVEQVLERPVRSFMSATDAEHEMQIQAFVLESEHPTSATGARSARFS